MMGSEKGSVLVIVITGITIIAAIGAGLAAMVSSGARTGANYSLSVQALYAAESGLEWAGSELRSYQENNEWVNFCAGTGTEADPGLKGETRQIKQNVQAFFTIVDSKIYPVNGTPQGCEVTVSGWVGSDKDNPLAKRQIKGDVPKGFIEASGDNDGIGGDGVTLNDFPVENGDVVFVEKGTIITTDVNIPNQAEVYFGQNVSVTGEVTIKPQGFAYFGDNFSLEGNIEIKGDACLKDNVSIKGYLKISTGAGELVCIGDDLYVKENLDVGNNAQVCIGEDPVYKELAPIDKNNKNNKDNKGTICFSDDTSDECTTLCESCTSICEDPEFESVSSNPVDTGEGSWSEG